METVLDKNSRKYLMGLSILGVFLFHIVDFSYKHGVCDLGLIRQLFENGSVGVDFFFFISVFGLGYSVEKNSLMQYYLNRLQKLFPLYFFFLTLLYIFFREDIKISYWWLICSQSTGVATFFYNIEWYVPALILLYAIYPLAIWIVRKYEWFAFGVIVIVAYLGGEISYWTHCHILLVTRIPIILAGILCYLNRKKQSRLYLICLFMIVFGIICSRVSYCVPFLLLNLNKFLKKQRESKLFNIFSFLGDYSLEIYLAQTITTNYLIGHLENSCGIFYVVLLTLIITTFFVILDKYVKKGFVKLGVRK